ncbi:MAG TPA: universal stress protein [Thermoplasmata archaeon]|jgi:nucleotide-binding universal stress UspA family protein|nr:universal stress protein [Thermoplasmata archaeon]
MAGRILACVDPSPSGRQALASAIEMAVKFGRGLTLLTVLAGSEADSHPDLDRLVPIDSEGRSIQRVLEDAQAEATKRGVSSTEIVYLRGDPLDAILAYLEKASPELVVVGTRGRSRGSRLLLGSVSSRLVSEAPCPVLVVRPVRRPAAKPA